MGGGDPRKLWDEFAAWVQQEVATAASANFIWATQRVRALARARRRPLLRRPRPAAAGAARRPVGRDLVGAPDGSADSAEEKGLAAKALIGLRGGYLEHGRCSACSARFIGFASAVNPIGIGAGVSSWAARRSATSGRSRSHRRQNEAKAATAPLRRRRHLPGRARTPATGCAPAARPARPLHRAGRPAQALAAGRQQATDAP